MSGRIVNDILNFEVTYNFMVWKVRASAEESELMQTLEQHIIEKEWIKENVKRSTGKRD